MTSPRASIAAAFLAAGILLAPPARAELGWPKLTLSNYLGVMHTDGTYGVSSPIPLGVRAGFIFSGRLGLEGSYGKVHGTGEGLNGHRFPLNQLGLDVVVNFRPGAKVTPYVLAGWSEIDRDLGLGNSLRLPGKEIGGGARIRLAANPGARWDLRLDLRDQIVKNAHPLDDAGRYKNTVTLSAGISVTLANPERDTDGDGVLDQFDRCPNTPAGAQVDPFGCPLDYDQDGVPDGLDRCPSTPLGAKVDAHGCPIDSDGDGVPDGVDLCDGTPAGAVIDASGCALDSDGDGVFDGIDRCPATPADVPVDATGCPITPDPAAVETDLLDSGRLYLDNVTFEPGGAVLRQRSYPVLDELGRVLIRRPEIKVEIGGHVDSSGNPVADLKLSQDRAQAVLDYLLRRYPLDAGRFTVMGYGDTRPLIPAITPEARERNRRIEIKVVTAPAGR